MDYNRFVDWLKEQPSKDLQERLKAKEKNIETLRNNLSVAENERCDLLYAIQHAEMREWNI